METPKLYAELAAFMAGERSKELAELDDKAMVVAFNEQIAKRFRPLSAKEVLDALTSKQLATLAKSESADAKAVMLYLSAGLSLDVEPGTAGRKRLNEMAADAALLPIVTAIKQAADETYPAWQKLECERAAHHGDAAWIRKQADKAAKEALSNG